MDTMAREALVEMRGLVRTMRAQCIALIEQKIEPENEATDVPLLAPFGDEGSCARMSVSADEIDFRETALPSFARVVNLLRLVTFLGVSGVPLKVLEGLTLIHRTNQSFRRMVIRDLDPMGSPILREGEVSLEQIGEALATIESWLVSILMDRAALIAECQFMARQVGCVCVVIEEITDATPLEQLQGWHEYLTSEVLKRGSAAECGVEHAA